MARKFNEKSPKELENIVKESIYRIGIRELPDEKIALLTRLIFSGIGNYFFLQPDNLINMGFLQFGKNPDKDELFHLTILRNDQEGVINAGALWRYYKGELSTENELRDIIDSFVNELLDYSQAQETNITKLTNKLR